VNGTDVRRALPQRVSPQEEMHHVKRFTQDRASVSLRMKIILASSKPASYCYSHRDDHSLSGVGTVEASNPVRAW